MFGKIFTKRNINYVILFLSCFLYIYMMYFSKVSLHTGKKELENVMIMALPCFMFLSYSISLKDKAKRKKILVMYLICYFIMMISFTFSNFRDTYLIDSGIMDVEYNLIPFKSIITMMNSSLGPQFYIYNILGNFLMLTPLSILLPLINNKFKKLKNFLILIIILVIMIETMQYITKLGSFDIDDFILNVSGSLIFYLLFTKTKLKNFIYNLFFKLTVSKRTSNIIYILLLTSIIITYIIYVRILYVRAMEDKVYFTNLNCVKEEKTYLGMEGKYNYYSECKLDGYILLGTGAKIYSDELVDKFSYKIEEYKKELRLIKEEAITNVEIILGDYEIKKLIYDTTTEKIYLVGIESIGYNRNGIDYYVEDSLPTEYKKIGIIHELVESTKHEFNKGYVVQEGEYYNILSCITHRDTPPSIINDYILPLNYEITEKSCNEFN